MVEETWGTSGVSCAGAQRSRWLQEGPQGTDPLQGPSRLPQVRCSLARPLTQRAPAAPAPGQQRSAL